MLSRYLNFLYGLSCNWTGKAGIALTTSSFVTFVLLEVPRLLGVLTNAYLGLLTYLLLPLLFVVGLLLIPLGWRRYRKQSGRPTRELLAERFTPEAMEGRVHGSRLVLTVAGLSLLNVLFLGAASVRMLRFMDQADFCGTACHSVMNPEWVTYQESPHARVACVECHVGQGVQALIDSKLNGAWQLLSITFDLYERPIPTPVHQLRPARETCEHCHWPDKFYGRRLKTIVRYGADRESTPAYTTLSLKVDASRSAGADAGRSTGADAGRSTGADAGRFTGADAGRFTGADAGGHPGAGGIHWHVAAANEVRYASAGDRRERMLWVEVRRPDGSYHRYQSRRPAGAGEAQEVRVLDCVDCHNRATHIYEDPRDAVGAALSSGALDRSLPFIRRESFTALTRGYPDSDAAAGGIRQHLESFYGDRQDADGGRSDPVETAVRVLQRIHRRNVHPGMRITWGVYPSQLSHRNGRGCFRCHSPDLVDAAGRPIGQDCTLCHSILAYGSSGPFEFLSESDPDDPEGPMHEHLRAEFLGGLD